MEEYKGMKLPKTLDEVIEYSQTPPVKGVSAILPTLRWPIDDDWDLKLGISFEDVIGLNESAKISVKERIIDIIKDYADQKEKKNERNGNIHST